MSDSNSSATPANKIVLMTNFRTMFPETIKTLNLINDILDNLGFKLLLLSNSISSELKCEVVKIPFSLKDYSSIEIDEQNFLYNQNLIAIDAEFNDDKNPDIDLYESGIQKCFSVAHKIAQEIKPAISFLWSGTVPQSIIFKQVFTEYFIPTFFVERGLLPESLMSDESGNGALSSMKINLNIKKSHSDYSQRYEEVKKYFLQNKIDKHEQANYLSGEEFIISKNLTGKKIIFFAGQWDVASGVNSAYDYQSVLNSPFFRNTEEAFYNLAEAILLKENVVLIFKPHPFDSRNYNNPDETKIIIDKKINIRTLLESADVIAVMSTTVQYESLFYEKPLLLLGNSFLSGQNVGYSIYDKNDLTEVMDEALSKISFEEKLENAKRFTSLISNEFMISLNEQNPIKTKLKDFISDVINKYNLTNSIFDDSADFKKIVRAFRKTFNDNSGEKVITELIERANEAIEKNEFVEAKKILIDVLTKYDGESVDAANSLAVCEIILGNYNDAENILQQILEREAGNKTAIANYNYLKTLLTEKIEKT